MSIYFTGQELVEMGVKIEEIGKQFYESYAKYSKDDKIRDLFLFLAEEEAKHKQKFLEILDSMERGEFTISYNDEEVDNYFRAIVDTKIFSDKEAAIKLAKNSEGELEAINYALSFEKETLIFYYWFIDIVKEKTKDVIDKLINEEKSHIVKLSEVKNRIKNLS